MEDGQRYSKIAVKNKADIAINKVQGEYSANTHKALLVPRFFSIIIAEAIDGGARGDKIGLNACRTMIGARCEVSHRLVKIFV